MRHPSDGRAVSVTTRESPSTEGVGMAVRRDLAITKGEEVLHFDPDILVADLKDLIHACIQGVIGTNTHQTLAARLRDPDEPHPTTVRMAILANCANCRQEIQCALETVWHRGSPLRFAMRDDKCPACGSTQGFHYNRTHGFYA
jgi:hypothetical protein